MVSFTPCVFIRASILSAAPSGINVLEHESIALDMPNSYSTFQSPHTYLNKAFSNSVETLPQHPSPPPQEIFKPTFTLPPQPRELPRQRLPESFNLVTPLSGTFSLRTDSSVSIYRARMENRNVVLRVLNGEIFTEVCLWVLQISFGFQCKIQHFLFLSLADSANATERHNFLGFASFLAQLGPHPFLPELLGVVSLRAPLVTVVEELENRDLLSFLWRCREVGRYIFNELQRCSVCYIDSPSSMIKSKCKSPNRDVKEELFRHFCDCLSRTMGIRHVKWQRDEYLPWQTRWPVHWLVYKYTVFSLALF